MWMAMEWSGTTHRDESCQMNNKNPRTNGLHTFWFLLWQLNKTISEVGCREKSKAVGILVKWKKAKWTRKRREQDPSHLFVLHCYAYACSHSIDLWLPTSVALRTSRASHNQTTFLSNSKLPVSSHYNTPFTCSKQLFLRMHTVCCYGVPHLQNMAVSISFKLSLWVGEWVHRPKSWELPIIVQSCHCIHVFGSVMCTVVYKNKRM